MRSRNTTTFSSATRRQSVLSEIPANAAASGYVAPRATATNATRTTDHGNFAAGTRHLQNQRCRAHHLRPPTHRVPCPRRFGRGGGALLLEYGFRVDVQADLAAH